jgi:hypothetical protein
MSDTFAYPETPSVIARSFPIVRVVEKNTRTLPLQKINIQEFEEPEDDVLSDAYQAMVTEAAEQVLAKQIEELAAKSYDCEEVKPDPEVDKLLEAVIDDDGEYVREPWLDPITKEYVSALQADKPHPTGEALMTSDEDDIVLDDVFDIDPVATFLPDVHPEVKEETMKDEPKPKLAADDDSWRYQGEGIQRLSKETIKQASEKQAAEKGTLQFLKSVEGLVLTVLEAAIASDSQREAVKSLIKKEFRREMNKVNRLPDED